jgi:hypothetical protein
MASSYQYVTQSISTLNLEELWMGCSAIVAVMVLMRPHSFEKENYSGRASVALR